MNIDDILTERGKVHGVFDDDARCAQRLKAVVHAFIKWDGLGHVHKEAIEMIFTKIARIVVGNHNHVDHWVDIAGYATLVASFIKDIHNADTDSASG